MRKNIGLVVVLLAVLSAVAFGRGGEPEPAAAPRMVDESRDAAVDGTVSIRTYAGSVRVTGWDRPAVRVTGTLGRDILRLDFSSSGNGTAIETVPPDRNRITSKQQLSCELEVKVPAGSSVRVSSLGADVMVRSIGGTVECDTLGGKIDVAGVPGVITLRTLNGPIAVTGPVRRVSFQTMGSARDGREEGGVTIEGEVPEIMGSTLGGTVTVRGAVMRDYDISTLSGAIELDGSLAKDGRVKVDAGLGGSIALTLPADVQGTFTLNCPWDRVDLKGFSPRAGITWVFRNEGTAEAGVRSEGGDEGAPSGRLATGIVIPGRMIIDVPDLPRITLGGSFSEFEVGAPGKARVYLEVGPLRMRSSGSGIVLKTK